MNNHDRQGNIRHSFSVLRAEDGLDLKDILEQLYRHLWIILAASFCTFMIAFLYSFTIKPRYQSTALLQIRNQNSNSSLLTNLGYKTANISNIDVQVALLKTRYILEPVVLENNLNIIATPRYFPFFGAWMARHYQKKGLAKPFFGLSSYAWGGEQIKVKKFAVPQQEAGHLFRVIARDHGAYQLYNDRGDLLLSGQAGVPAMAKTGLTLELASLMARPGTQFTIRYETPVNIAKSLAYELQISPLIGNDQSQNTGIVQLQLSGLNPLMIVKTLNAIVNYAVAQNAKQKAQETQKTLEFLNQRLPDLKNHLQKAEDALNQYHIKNNTLSMSVVSQILVRELVLLEQAIEKIKSQKEELLQIYTSAHPLVQAAAHKEEVFEKKLSDIKAQIKKFPLVNQEEINLLRDAKIKNEMYVSLLNHQQQLEIIKAGLTPDMIALTDATPAIKVPSHKLMLCIMGFLMGAFVSFLVILLKTTLSKTITNHEQLETEFQTPVQSIIPYSRNQKKMEKNNQKANGALSPLILARYHPDDAAIESLRSLRVSLHVMSASANHHVIALMGSQSHIGKSFISLNLAQVIADTGKRTLLIDADIRKGQLHKSMQQPKVNGLSEYLENKCRYEHLIRPINKNLFFIANGSYNAHPIELFQHPLFKDFMLKCKTDFDQVIIDTPPVIPVSDAILIAQHCEKKLFVVSAAKDTLSDVKQAIKKIRAHGIDIDGILFNHHQSLGLLEPQPYYRYAYTAS